MDRAARGRIRRVLRERRWTIVFVAVMFTGVAVLFDLRSEKTYAPYAVLQVSTLSPNTPALGIRRLRAEVPPEVAAARVGRTIVEPEVIEGARRRLGTTVPSGYSLYGRVQAAGGGAPGRVIIVLRDPDAVRGARAANAVAAAASERITRRELERLDQVIAALRRQRRTIVPDGRRGSRSRFRRRLMAAFRRQELDHQLATLETLRSIAEPAAVVRQARPPEHPEFKPGKRAWPALYFGLILGTIASFVLDTLARRPRDPALLERAAGLPVLARTPKLGRRRAADVRLAYEQLWSAASGLGAGTATRQFALVTSAEPGAGKSTVALGMARAAAAAGRRACLVECDLRRPTLAERLGLSGAGVADLVAGRADSSTVVVETPGGAGGAPLHLVHAGSPTRRPAQAIESTAFQDLLDSLAATNDFIVLDAPPIFAGSDVLALARAADVIVLCGRLGSTPVDELEAAREALGRLPAMPAGLVLTGVPLRRPTLARGGARYRPSPEAA